MITDETRSRRVSLRVRVVDAVTGAPVPGADVIVAIGADAAQAEPLTAPSAAEAVRALEGCGVRATADALGRAVLWGLRPGHYSVAAQARRGDLVAPLAVGLATVSEDGRVPWTTLALPSTLLIGAVTRRLRSLRPVAGVTVQLKGTGERARTDSQGRYQLAGIGPGPRTVEVLEAAQAPTTWTVTIEPAPAVTRLDISLP